MGRLDLPDKRRDEDEHHPEDRALRDRRFGITPELRAKIAAIQANPERGRQLPRQHRSESLTERRLQVLRLAAEGKSNQEIAVELGIGIETVKVHIRMVLHLLDARTRAHAVAVAYELELFVPGTVRLPWC